jgi:hypothetical protein
MLNRDNVNHDASPALDHAGDKSTIKTHCGEQIQIQRLHPVIIGKRKKTAVRFMRAANAVYENIDAAPLGEKLIHNCARTARRANIVLHEEFRSLTIR